MTLRAIGLMWGVLAVVAATALFLVKYEVIALEDDLSDLHAAIERDRTAIHVLRAEWSYLNQPGRLGELGVKHLGLVPMSGADMVSIEALPFRPAPTRATGDDGVALRPLALPPRVLNPGTPAAIPLPGRKPSPLARMEAQS